MSTPREFLLQLRQERFQLDIDLDGIPQAKRDQLIRSRNNLHQDLNETLRLLSDDLYQKDTHFVLELIQNADDNSYRPTETPRLEIVLSAERLVVQNNEIG